MPSAKRKKEEQRRHLQKKISSDILARGSNAKSVILSDQLIFRWQNAMSTLLFVERFAKWVTRSQQKKRRVRFAWFYFFDQSIPASFFLLHSRNPILLDTIKFSDISIFLLITSGTDRSNRILRMAFKGIARPDLAKRSPDQGNWLWWVHKGKRALLFLRSGTRISIVNDFVFGDAVCDRERKRETDVEREIVRYRGAGG